MPTTRRQTQEQNGAGINDTATNAAAKPPSKASKPSEKKNAHVKASPEAEIGEKREVEYLETKEEQAKGEPPAKKAKTEETETKEVEEKFHAETSEQAEKDENMPEEQESHEKQEESKADDTTSAAEGAEEAGDTAAEEDNPMKHAYETGTIERGHIYFFYRPRVELDGAESLDDVQRFYMLLIPRPPEFSTALEGLPPPRTEDDNDEDQEMTLLAPGADVIPAAEPTDQPKKHFRLLVIGKKSLPNPEVGGGKGGGRHQVFWATIVTVGDDLKALQEALGEKTYETKTRGTRHQGPARLAARGAYAIVNSDARVPSDRETHMGYHLSHPTSEHFGEVQAVLGIHTASSFVLQVKNPLAPSRIGLPKGRRVEFTESIMKDIFGMGGQRGREDYGLRFASLERREMLDYEGVELLFIAARSGEAGLESSLGEGRGTALQEREVREGKESIQQVFKELAMDSEEIPADPLQGKWA